MTRTTTDVRTTAITPSCHPRGGTGGKRIHLPRALGRWEFAMHKYVIKGWHIPSQVSFPRGIWISIYYVAPWTVSIPNDFSHFCTADPRARYTCRHTHKHRPCYVSAGYVAYDIVTNYQRRIDSHMSLKYTYLLLQQCASTGV